MSHRKDFPIDCLSKCLDVPRLYYLPFSFGGYFISMFNRMMLNVVGLSNVGYFPALARANLSLRRTARHTKRLVSNQVLAAVVWFINLQLYVCWVLEFRLPGLTCINPGPGGVYIPRHFCIFRNNSTIVCGSILSISTSFNDLTIFKVVVLYS